MIRLIDAALLDEVTAEARAGPRGRKNRNFHAADSQPAHRLLNAIEPGSYVAPHRHRHPDKGETMLVLRGTLGLVTFDDTGAVVNAVKVSHGGTPIGVDIPHDTWHTVFALESGTVFFEAKAGPYVPLAADEKAAWAPAEGDPAAAACLARWVQLLD
jgi:cupin fold WbuC family metalloprotein